MPKDNASCLVVMDFLPFFYLRILRIIVLKIRSKKCPAIGSPINPLFNNSNPAPIENRKDTAISITIFRSNFNLQIRHYIQMLIHQTNAVTGMDKYKSNPQCMKRTPLNVCIIIRCGISIQTPSNT